MENVVGLHASAACLSFLAFFFLLSFFSDGLSGERGNRASAHVSSQETHQCACKEGVALLSKRTYKRFPPFELECAPNNFVEGAGHTDTLLECVRGLRKYAAVTFPVVNLQTTEGTARPPQS